MQFDSSAEDLAFRKRARDWLRIHVPAGKAPHSGLASREFTLAWLRTLHGAGWSGIAWPVEYGGRGFTLEQQIIWYEECVAAGAPSPLNPSFVAVNHAGPTLIAYGTQAQKAFHLPKILAGEVLWCQGFSEPGAGSDLASLRTNGVVDGNHLVVNGHKIWTSFADIAEYQELLIRTQPGSQRHRGLSWVICDMRSAGITIRPIANLAGATHFAEVFYDDVRIPLDNVVGGLHDGWNVAMRTLGFERTTAAGALQLELSAKVDQLARLLAADAEAARDGTLIEELALLRAEAAAMRALTYRTLFKDPDTPSSGSIVRLYFAELSQRIHGFGMKLLGPRNAELHAPYDWAHAYLESYSETIAGGTSEIQRNIIGERILGLPR